MKKILIPDYCEESVLLGEKEQDYGPSGPSGYITDEMKEISTSIPTFQTLIENDAVYVDKTRQLYSLVSSKVRNFFFLARPRRYGKSLFCSTLHALFDGRKELFKGLYIAERTDYAFERYPVFHFDFSSSAS